MTILLFILQFIQLGLSITDLEFLSIGLINDMYSEHINDNCNYDTPAIQKDFVKF